MDATPTYRLIKGSKRRVSGIASQATWSLWAANDHLLLADRSWFFERFKHFDFQDVQGIVMTPSWVHWVARGALLAIISTLGGFAILFALMEGTEMLVSSIIFLVLALLFLPFLIRDFYRGPSCRTFLVTAVQRVELPSLNRVKNAQRVIAEIAELIRATQGEIRAEDCPPETAGITSRPVVPVFASQPAEPSQPS